MHLCLTFSVFVAFLLGATILFVLGSKKKKKSLSIIVIVSAISDEVNR